MQIAGLTEWEGTVAPDIARTVFGKFVQYSGILHMAYDTPTVQLLRTILAEVLSSQAFTRQHHQTAVDVAERILWLASQGERDPAVIKEYVLTEVLARSAA